MASSLCPRLPVELQDIILDLLFSSDEEETRALSAVCQHWRLKIYRHAFAEVHINQTTAEHFSSIVDSPFSCSGILPAIKDLHLRTKGCEGHWTASEHIALTSVLEKTCQWSKVTSLELKKDGGDCRLGLQHFSAFSFPYLTTLTLRRLTFVGPKDFIGFIGLFPALKHVNFDDVRCDWPEEIRSKIPSGDFVLALVIHSVSARRTTIKWTLEGPVSSIDPEDIYSLGWLTQADIQTLLRTIGPSLRTLDIDFQLPYSSLLEHLVNALDLSVTPRLRHIRIGSSTRVLSFMDWVPRVLYGLAKTNHPCLDVLEIRFASSRQFHLDRPFLRCLTVGLEEPQYSAIKKINFIAYHDNLFDKDVEKAITQTIQKDLMRWHEQGLIALTFRLRETSSTHAPALRL
ncbi:hypothetical protein BDN70DRAFT_880851 [Pholiota conissans]|uniref:F-box domain-containing protein n=1 Tax=Pholiota conissans TaxID=109636 RepID=A0A9P5Z103_9AGAR|nr:hypothetical protein BDN70DRAFT_880851 [Pholiota conissans]